MTRPARGPWRWLAERAAERRALAEYRRAWRRLRALHRVRDVRQDGDVLRPG